MASKVSENPAESTANGSIKDATDIYPDTTDSPQVEEDITSTATDTARKDEQETSLEPLERAESETVYPEGIKLTLLLLGIYCSIFLVALDRTIIATALPTITNEFHGFADVGWYNGAFTMTTCAFQLFFGRVYTFYPPKWVFLILVVVFEVGSAICGAAPNSVAFIWGRAIAGLGAAGLFNGSNVLLIYAAPLHKRALYTGLIAAVFGVASVTGPPIGGVFTTSVSWRWCFYINLPIGALTLIFLFWVLPETPPPESGLTFKQKIGKLDIPGTAVLLPAIVCILLALQWGGQTYPWSDGRIIALFVLFGVLIIAFAGIQVWQKESATIPPRLLKRRSVLAGAWFSFFFGSTFLIPIYYTSIWFQAIKGETAIISGVSLLPLLLGLVIASIGSGALVMRFGPYKPAMIISAILLPIATGLFILFKVNTGHPMWIGVLFFFGIAMGCGFQQPNIAAQTVLPKKDVATGISLVFFVQIFGPTIFVAVSQSLLENHLVSKLTGLDGFTREQIVNTGATDLRRVFPAKDLPYVLEVYNEAIIHVFYLAVSLACFAIFGALTIENKSVKKKEGAPEGKAGAAKVDEEAPKVEEEAPGVEEEAPRAEDNTKVDKEVSSEDEKV